MAMTTNGTVYLVGAGPGDPELLTVRARRLLDEADVVFHDSLVGDGVVESIPDRVRAEHVGKRADGERTPQAAINERLVCEASAGRDVVRLKGGDPTVFARGGEEAEHLARHGVPFEIVPGITSAVAGPGVAGIPATHRDHASAFVVVTGHEDPSKDDSSLDWDALSGIVATGGTLVILMGVGRLPDNVAALREGAVGPDTPVAMVERATLADERVVTGTIDTIVDRAEAAGIEPPAVTVVGDVVDVRETVAHCLGEEGTAAETPSAGRGEELAGVNHR
ncbi:uroporphyrinogen-III C-methyltransferase [Halapricum hydrolyticum]|uniref:uroporphyrinogen-III C-methyltransferase n=1 Tax=Halapricum hydrolyticum TaxID=2979991 RepID=A0AAE3IB81_9EURY|nr:uroporphyrinogen-III C-methyltransferase [Halapricum hydrolyticum]MCU4717747.1 uroporphyrinogen-III C-methyltransferase [Halapricum hydrolyticum]MCU4726911.1 uroporphyrinogen-III C-methyltransferase [Halapricum hydrolyticum]